MSAMLDRQKSSLQERALEEDAKILDVFNCVERLHGVELRKLVSEKQIAKVPRQDRPPSKVSVPKLYQALPRHIMACLLAQQPASPANDITRKLTDCQIESRSHFQHVCKGFQLLSTLSSICVHPGGGNKKNKIGDDGINGNDDLTNQLIDAVILALLAIAAPESDTIIQCAKSSSEADIQAVLDRASIVPAALKALVLVLSGPGMPALLGDVHWEAVCDTLFSHPRGGVLLDAMFEATRILVIAVREAMCGPASEQDVFQLAFSTGGSMEFATYLSATPLFYYRMMRHDASGGAPLRLILECLTLHDMPIACPPFKRLIPDEASGGAAARPVLTAGDPPYSTQKGAGAAELLAARGFALLVLLGEYENPSYMDELFKSPDSKALAERIVSRAAAYIGQVLLRPKPSVYPAAPGESQMAINVLRAAELLSDDSNFKPPLIKGLAPTIAQLLQQPDEGGFMSLWGAGEEAVRYHAKDDILINSVTEEAMKGVNRCSSASKTYFSTNKGAAVKFNGLNGEQLKLGRHLALERAVLLTKLLVNLHFWCEEVQIGEKDDFVRSLISSLRASPSGLVAMSHAVHNVYNLFALSREFGLPYCKPEHEMMNEIDMDLSQDLLTKLNAALSEARVQQQQQQQQLLPQQEEAAAWHHQSHNNAQDQPYAEHDAPTNNDVGQHFQPPPQQQQPLHQDTSLGAGQGEDPQALIQQDHHHQQQQQQEQVPPPPNSQLQQEEDQMQQ